jgi:hypothetical protein
MVDGEAVRRVLDETGASIFPPVGVKSDSLTTERPKNERHSKATERYSVW